MVFSEGLPAVCAEAVLEERIDLNWGANGVDGADI